MQKVVLSVKYIDIKELSKWDINPRVISDKGLKDLKHKIEKYPKFMEARPILVNISKDKPNEKIVFAGNQRLEATRQLGWEQVPVIIFNDLSSKEQKELALIDNHNDGEWSFDTLKLHFMDIDFEPLGLPNLNLQTPSFQIPNIETNETLQAITKEIPINDSNDIKQEQIGYPVNNQYDKQEVNTHSSKKIICPHCGEEFEL